MTWILFARGVPEHGFYSMNELGWLVEQLSDDVRRHDDIQHTLEAMPLGEMQEVEGRLVVKILRR